MISIAVVCEARADRDTACQLADRILCNDVDWIEPEVLDDYRHWRGYQQHEEYLTWATVRDLAKQKRIHSHGHFDGKPGALDANMARQTLLVLQTSNVQADAIVLVRDDDRETKRRIGLEQARNDAIGRAQQHGTTHVPIVIGLAHVNRESWVLAGFVPISDREETLLSDARRELGFAPNTHPEKLTAKHDHDKLSAKRVLKDLTQGDAQRESACWRETPFESLRQPSQQNGLDRFLTEVQDHLVPLFAEPFKPGQSV